VFGQKSKALHLCDIDSPVEVSCRLAAIGECLKLDNCTKLMRLFKNVPAFADLVFEELKPNAHCQAVIDQYNEGRQSRQRMQDRKGILRRFQLLEGYRAHHQWHYFCAPIWEACTNGCECFDEFIKRKTNDLKALPLRSEALYSFMSSGFTPGIAILSGTSVWEYLLLFLKGTDLSLENFARLGGLVSLVSGAVRKSVLAAHRIPLTVH
jgi:hypothetical protein